MMDVLQLDRKIAAVCPIDGIRIDNPEDKSTWVIWFKAEATDAQKAAAHAVVAAFDTSLSPVPSSVKMWQAKAALDEAGKLEAAQALVDSAPTPVRLAWEYASDISRNSNAIKMIGANLGLTEDDLDWLFRQAEGIQV